jgi:uncharacterized protein YecE (DUF72 family)
MVYVGCSGFPVPATRYLKEFVLTEVADTHLGVPGPALVRRWRRESPPGFVFTALCPRELTAEGFAPTAAAEAAWQAFVPVARDLEARALVVLSPPELTPTKALRAQFKSFIERLKATSVAPLVWEPPVSWDLKEAEALAKDLPVLVARDPYRHPAPARAERVYYRLTGQAGFKSRYEDAALEAIAEKVAGTRAEEVMVILANVDMYADAKRLRRLLDG